MAAVKPPRRRAQASQERSLEATIKVPFFVLHIFMELAIYRSNSSESFRGIIWCVCACACVCLRPHALLTPTPTSSKEDSTLVSRIGGWYNLPPVSCAPHPEARAVLGTLLCGAECSVLLLRRHDPKGVYYPVTTENWWAVTGNTMITIICWIFCITFTIIITI